MFYIIEPIAFVNLKADIDTLLLLGRLYEGTPEYQ